MNKTSAKRFFQLLFAIFLLGMAFQYGVRGLIEGKTVIFSRYRMSEPIEGHSVVPLLSVCYILGFGILGLLLILSPHWTTLMQKGKESVSHRYARYLITVLSIIMLIAMLSVPAIGIWYRSTQAEVAEVQKVVASLPPFEKIELTGTLKQNQGELVPCGEEANEFYLAFDTPQQLSVGSTLDGLNYIMVFDVNQEHKLDTKLNKEITLTGHLEGGCGERGFLVVE